MKRYAALLRGINQSGKNKISMSDLKKAFCDIGFSEVRTILNSGNVLFSAESDDKKEMSLQISDRIRQDFGFEIFDVILVPGRRKALNRYFVEGFRDHVIAFRQI